MLRRAILVGLLAAALAASTVARAAPDLGPSQGACEPRPVAPLGQGFFTDVSVASGIKADPPPSPLRAHARIGFVDLDGDGFDDIVAHNMSGGVRAGTEKFEHLVWRNQGDGTFVDFAAASGLRDVQASLMAFGDVDNDGDEDVFAGLDIHDHPDGGQHHRLLLNDGAGHFTERPNSGVEVGRGTDDQGRPLFGVGAAVFADFDGDAKLDLYVGNGNTGSVGFYMTDQLFLGRGDGTFTDVSSRLGGVQPSLSNGAMACDFDDDGDLDVFVSTYGVSGPDSSQKRLWINDGQARFANQAVARGVASQAGGNTWRADMDYGRKVEPGKLAGQYVGANGFGVDCPDINNDGHIDILMAAIAHSTEFPAGFRGWPQDEIDRLNYTRRWADPTQILVNRGPGGQWAFANEWQARGLPYNEGDIDAASADFDNDGLMDIAVSRDKKYEGNYTTLEQLGWLGLYHQLSDGKFESVGARSGINQASDPAGNQRMRGSGVIAWSDIEHDGDLDVLIGGGPGATSGHLFRNDAGTANDWLAVRLRGDGVDVNRDAMGARVTITDGTRALTREVKGSRGTYNALDTRVLHFGLGDMACDYRLTVRWPGGQEEVFSGAELGRNRYVDLEYTAGIPPVQPTATPGATTAVPPTGAPTEPTEPTGTPGTPAPTTPPGTADVRTSIYLPAADRSFVR